MFDVFRRNQKRWLTAITILAMMAFAFPLTNFFGSGRRQGDKKIEVVETIFDRNVTNADLSRARYEREIANRFVVEIRAAVGDRFALTYPEFVEMQYGFGPTRDEEAIKDALRQAHKADQFGVRVSDDMIRDWIKSQTDGKLSTEQFQAVVRKMRKMGEEISVETLFEILRNQLRIGRVYELVLGRYGSTHVTPYEAWQFYRRLNDKLTLEMVPVLTSAFADKIDDPGDSALRELYSKYVSRLPDPASPEPGFKEPRKAQLQYASASLDAFLLALQTEIEVTDDEIQQYYESHKDLYRVFPSPPGTEPKSPEKPTDAGPATLPDKPKDEAPKSEDDGKEKPLKDKDGDGAKKDDSKNSSPDSPPAGNPDEKCEETLSDDPPTAPSDQEAKPQTTADSKPAAAKPADEKSDKKSAEKKDESKADQEPPAEKPDQEAPKADDSKSTTKPDSDKAESKEPGEPQDKKPDPPMYKPLDEVKPEIYDKLARNKARDKLVLRMEQVQKLVNGFADDTFLPAKNRFEDSKDKQPKQTFKPPPPPDLTKPIEELGLKFAETGLASLEELSKDERLGEATELVGESSSGRSLASIMAAADMYDPLQFKNFQDDFFVVWKVADVPASEPAFAAIRDKVLAAYRTIKARDLAKERAKKLADALQGFGGDMAKLGEAEPGIETISIPPVPLWSSAAQFSPNNMFSPSQVEPTELPGVPLPGDDLRSTAFKLKEGEVAVSSNQPEDTYYVILLTKREPASMESFARSRTMIEDQLQTKLLREMATQWRAELRKESGPKNTKAPAGN